MENEKNRATLDSQLSLVNYPLFSHPLPRAVLTQLPQRIAVISSAIEEILLDFKSTLGRQALDHRQVVFLRYLHENCLPLAEVEAMVQGIDPYRLFFAADQKRAGGTFDRAINRIMCPFTNIEIRTKLAVDSFEQIQIKPRRNAVFIIVRPNYHMRIFLQVETNEEEVVRVHYSSQITEKLDRLSTGEIADIRTKKQQNFPAAATVFDRLQNVKIVALSRLHPQGWKFGIEFCGQRLQRFLRNIDR